MKIIKSILINTLIFLGVCILYIISKILLSNALNEFLFVSILVSLGLANVLVILFIFFKKCLKFLGNIHKNKELLKEKQ